ncbi:MAG: hypothetical protein JKY61_07250 [Planctomycetes bacterium]|nr:hypothetical protein [Planctomycetota bacterium]
MTSNAEAIQRVLYFDGGRAFIESKIHPPGYLAIGEVRVKDLASGKQSECAKGAQEEQ